MNYEIDMDGTDFTVVATCPCGWRHFAFIRSDAWLRAAEHLKSTHGDLYAARRAAEAARKSRPKPAVTSTVPEPSDTKPHGNSGHTGTARKRATAHP